MAAGIGRQGGAPLPEAVCFDLDETLLDHGGVGAAIAAVCGAVAAATGLDQARVEDANARMWAEYWPAVEADWVTGKIDGATLVPEAWGRTLAACGVTSPPVLDLAVAEHWRLSRAAYRLFDDARPAIDALRERGARLALITNGPADVKYDKLGALGIEGWFDTIVISGDLGVAKPAVEPFRVALEGLGVDPGATWHVGDSLADDVAGANAAELTSVWLNRTGRARRAGDPLPDLEVRSLAGLSGPPAGARSTIA